jgi:hypothetical protein
MLIISVLGFLPKTLVRFSVRKFVLSIPAVCGIFQFLENSSFLTV